jgi:hypothetical protein
MLGSTIGQLSIDAGDGTLHYPFILEGKGKESFLLNNNGKLILTKTIDTVQDFNLSVTVSNEYGYSSQSIKIHVQNSGKIGKAQMGRLKNATIKLFKLNPTGTKDLISSTTSKSIGSLNQLGNFDLMTEQLDDHEFYMYEVSEGIDVDSDDNGEYDKNSSKNLGKLRLITKGIWIKNAMYKIRITPLSEILYTYVKNLPYSELEEQLHYHATLLLKESLDADYTIDAKDIILFNPVYNKDLLSPTLTYNNTYQKIVNKIRAGDESYQDDIFTAYTVDSYQANAIEIVGSTVYTIDMLNSGEFRIYDLESKKVIGKLQLPNTPLQEDNHILYINLLDTEARVTSLTNWSYKINFKNQGKPIMENEPYIQEALLSGSFTKIALGYSTIAHLFGQEKQTHLYNFKENNNATQIIKFLNVDKNDIFYQFQFDSKLINIQSLWVKNQYLYVIGDNKMHIFTENNSEANLENIYDKKNVTGNIIGIENNILYTLEKNSLILYNIQNPINPIFIEELTVPFNYKLGIKTNGEYITTGSKIIDIKALRASKNAK